MEPSLPSMPVPAKPTLVAVDATAEPWRFDAETYLAAAGRRDARSNRAHPRLATLEVARRVLGVRLVDDDVSEELVYDPAE